MASERRVGSAAPDARSLVVASRQQVEDRLDELRRALGERTGGRLGRRAWTLPLAAAAVGFSVALWLRRRGARNRH